MLLRLLSVHGYRKKYSVPHGGDTRYGCIEIAECIVGVLSVGPHVTETQAIRIVDRSALSRGNAEVIDQFWYPQIDRYD